jgi:hypothetical protein
MWNNKKLVTNGKKPKLVPNGIHITQVCMFKRGENPNVKQ